MLNRIKKVCDEATWQRVAIQYLWTKKFTVKRKDNYDILKRNHRSYDL